jgi:pyruvate formate lyase activating enzyme
MEKRTITPSNHTKIALRKTSFVDYPGRIAAALFFPGCSLRCPWCHNRELALAAMSGADLEGLVDIETALAHLEKRRAMLGGAVLSGGEPTLYARLPELIRRIKERAGLAVKLDTNGMNPAMLEKLLRTQETSPDYIALDLKLAPERYAAISGLDAEIAAARLRRSAGIIRDSGIEHEYRSLALPGVTEADIDALAPFTDNAPWYVRAFRPGNCLDPAWDGFPPSTEQDIARLTKRIRLLRENSRRENSRL